MTRLILKPIRDVAGTTDHRQRLGGLPAREAREVPRRKRQAMQAAASFREMLEAGRSR
jgi:hypothetical protein